MIGGKENGKEEGKMKEERREAENWMRKRGRGWKGGGDREKNEGREKGRKKRGNCGKGEEWEEEEVG